MNSDNSVQLDMIDDIYSLAFWLTGSKKDAGNLLEKTFQNSGTKSSEIELIKKFRICYFESIGKVPASGFTETVDQSATSLKRSLWQRFEDIKLTVLLAEIPGLKYRDIGEITGNTLDTIRLWLFLGRKLLKNGTLLKSAAWPRVTKANINKIVEICSISHVQLKL